ncbi:MAG: SDR family NAD(P)-dependent oxidoreductase [Halioglobus sp.]|nr:SDR family NAD(P)-dependent oxidoreductase [Halioglobus sp.]
MGDWQGSVAVITGAASGIGAGLARHCLGLGMHVVAADIDDAALEALHAGASTVPGGSLQARHLDVRGRDAVEALAADVFERFGAVSLLFNNAGVLVDGKSWERPERDWRWILEVNVMGVVHGISAFVPRMLAQGCPGRIINTSSIGGLLGGGPYLAPYQGTKHMVTALTESLYQELAVEAAPVTASVLCPGEVATGIWSSDRLRPQEQHNVLGSAAERQFHDAVAGSVAAGLSPDDFAREVFVGIEADRFWLLPQPAFKAQLAQRHESIMTATNPESLLAALAGQPPPAVES